MNNEQLEELTYEELRKIEDELKFWKEIKEELNQIFNVN